MQVTVIPDSRGLSSTPGEPQTAPEQTLPRDAAGFEKLLMGTLGREITNRATAPVCDTPQLLALLAKAQINGKSPHDHQDSVLALLASEYGAGNLPLRERNILRFLDDVFRLLARDAHLDPVIVALLYRFQIPISRLALLDHAFLDNPDHSGRLLVDEICYHGIGWYEALGKSGQRFLDTVCDTLSRLDHEFDENGDSITRICRDLREALEKEKAQLDKLAERTIATEKGLFKVRRAEQESIDLINRITVGRKLPIEMIHLLHQQWYPVLKQILLHHDTASDTWARMKKLTTNMVWTLLPSTDEAEKRKKYAVIPKLPDFIHEELRQHALPGVNVDRMIDVLTGIHLRMLKGETLDMQPVIPLNSTSLQAGVDVEISQPLIQQARTVEIGQWFLMASDNGPVQRVRLAQKDEDANYYLFLTRSGMKAADLSIERLAYYLVNGRLKALNHYRPFSAAFLKLTKQLLVKHEEYELRDSRDREQALQKADNEARVRMLAAEKARKEAEALARQEAEARQQAEEARQRAEEEARHAEERRRADEMDRERAELAAREKAYRQAIETMSLGTWVQFFNDDGSITECNVALKMRSTNKFVFVNRAGIKVGEKKGDELLALMLEGKFAIVDQSSYSDSAIQRLIGSLKRD